MRAVSGVRATSGARGAVRWAPVAAALLLGVGCSGFLLATALDAFTPLEMVVLLPAGWSFIGSGLAVWARRPLNHTGPLLTWTGVSFNAGLLQNSSLPVLAAVAQWIRPVHLGLFLWVLLAFPTGRLSSATARILVAAAFVNLVVVFHLPLVSPALAGAGDVSFAAGAVLFAAAAVLLLRRWSDGSPAWRRAVSPVLWPGAVTLLALAYYDVTGLFTEPSAAAIWVFFVAFALIPFAFLAVLLRVRLARASVAELVVELERALAAGSLREVLARAVGDPTAMVAYWLPAQGRYVDAAGHAVELPAAGSGRTVAAVERDGRRVAAIIHDEALADEPELMRAVTAAAALALDNERLQAELRARLAELTASRARIVEASAEERRRLARNLHDGAQQRLTSVTMALGLAEARLRSDPDAAHASLAQARQTLAAALADLRDLGRGIHPGALIDGGLRPALEDLAFVTPIPVRIVSDLDGERLPTRVEEGAYYVIAESLTNVAKHADATSVTVELTRPDGLLRVVVRDDGRGGADPARGTGLHGLADRVHALGGTLSVRSDDGEGTEIRASIPCA